MLKLLLALSMTISTFAGSLSPSYSNYYKPVEKPPVVEPTDTFTRLSDEEAAAYGELIVTYTTSFDPSNVNRSTNLRIALASLDNLRLLPGEVFSYNAALGQRTYSRGYRSAAVFASGGVVYQLGGGICQISSMLFNLALESNLEMVQRYYHGRYVTYVPNGRDATVYWGSQDFQFKNSLSVPLVIKTEYYDSGKAVTSLYAQTPVELPEIEIKVTQSGNVFHTYRYADGVQNYYTKSVYR